jgi:hypothetical protein
MITEGKTRQCKQGIVKQEMPQYFWGLSKNLNVRLIQKVERHCHVTPYSHNRIAAATVDKVNPTRGLLYVLRHTSICRGIFVF